MELRSRCKRSRGVGLISFDDVQYFGADGTQDDQVVVRGSELSSLFSALADAHECTVDGLLGNVGISAGEELPCRLLTAKPSGWVFTTDSEGYIRVKLRESRIPRGHSFLGDGTGSNDVEWEGSANAAQTAGSDPTRSPPSRSRRLRHAPSWLAGHSTSPGSPAIDTAGTTEYAVRLHRAAGLAASPRPERDSQRWMLHICGRKDCMVVAHYRPGDQSANEADKEHHKARPGTSREQHQPWQ
jgi:hypothetical protein